MNRVERIQKLDSLVQEAARRIDKQGLENTRLRAEVARLSLHNEQNDLQLRRQQGIGRKHDRLRSRLQKLLRKVDKALSTAG